ncbi:MAG: type II secretion system F family protein [Burkholderiales bacterium]
MDTLILLFSVAVFIAIVLLLEGVYHSWNSTKGPEVKRLERRLRTMSAGTRNGQHEVSILKQRLLAESPAMQRLLLQLPRVHALDRLLEQSGLSISVAKFLLYTFGGCVMGYLFGSFWRLPFAAALVLGLFFGIVPLIYVLNKKRQRLARIENQLSDALDLIGRAMRAGNAFPAALKMVGDEMSDPISGEFRITCDEVNYGVAMPDALMHLSTRVPSTDLRYFVIAVLIQRETGGNLAEILDNISHIVRDRIKLLGQVRVLSAEGRLSAWILALLPFCLSAVIYLLNPTFFSVLWKDPLGLKLIIAALIMMVLGGIWMRKIIHIHV